MAGPSGNYDYRTTFDLAGYNPKSASLSGLFAEDDPLVNILINGVATGQSGGTFTTFSSFSITSGFISGLNTIDFIVYNDSGPTGLRVEGVLSASVPEPVSLALLGVSLAGFALVRRFS